MGVYAPAQIKEFGVHPVYRVRRYSDDLGRSAVLFTDTYDNIAAVLTLDIIGEGAYSVHDVLRVPAFLVLYAFILDCSAIDYLVCIEEYRHLITTGQKCYCYFYCLTDDSLGMTLLTQVPVVGTLNTHDG